MISKLLSLIILLTFTHLVFGFEDLNCNTTDRSECCKKFEEKIWQYGISPGECCNYPKIVTPHFNPCFNECIANSSIEMNLRCCVVACCFRKLAMITDHPDVDGIQAEGMKLSFMLSVKKTNQGVKTLYF